MVWIKRRTISDERKGLEALMKVKVGMVSLGCAKNQVDAEMMLGRLLDGGYDLVSNVAEADVVVVNTCGFIADAKREAIEEILELGRLKKDGSLKKYW